MSSSAETVVRRGRITNHHLIAYSLSNISAKNYENRLIFAFVLYYETAVSFFETHCISGIMLRQHSSLGGRCKNNVNVMVNSEYT